MFHSLRSLSMTGFFERRGRGQAPPLPFEGLFREYAACPPGSPRKLLEREADMRKVTGVSLAAALVVGSVIAVVAIASPGMDPVTVAPHAFTVKLDTAKARVLEYKSKPGDKEPMHSHPAGILIVVKGGKFRSTTADGKSTTLEYKGGEVVWRDALTHTGENVGTTELVTYLIEFK
jgi:quercetin dioxygenase-like cupin family protein